MFRTTLFAAWVLLAPEALGVGFKMTETCRAMVHRLEANLAQKVKPGKGTIDPEQVAEFSRRRSRLVWLDGMAHQLNRTRSLLEEVVERRLHSLDEEVDTATADYFHSRNFNVAQLEELRQIVTVQVVLLKMRYLFFLNLSEIVGYDRSLDSATNDDISRAMEHLSQTEVKLMPHYPVPPELLKLMVHSARETAEAIAQDDRVVKPFRDFFEDYLPFLEFLEGFSPLPEMAERVFLVPFAVNVTQVRHFGLRN